MSAFSNNDQNQTRQSSRSPRASSQSRNGDSQVTMHLPDVNRTNGDRRSQGRASPSSSPRNSGSSPRGSLSGRIEPLDNEVKGSPRGSLSGRVEPLNNGMTGSPRGSLSQSAGRLSLNNGRTSGSQNNLPESTDTFGGVNEPASLDEDTESKTTVSRVQPLNNNTALVTNTDGSESKLSAESLDEDEGDTPFVVRFTEGDCVYNFRTNRKSALMSELIKASLSGEDRGYNVYESYQDEGKINSARTLSAVIEFINHHNGVAPPLVDHPLKSKDFAKLTNNWDADYIKRYANKLNDLKYLAIAANYLDINSLLHLASAGIAMRFKGAPTEEIGQHLEITDDEIAESKRLDEAFCEESVGKGIATKGDQRRRGLETKTTTTDLSSMQLPPTVEQSQRMSGSSANNGSSPRVSNGSSPRGSNGSSSLTRSQNGRQSMNQGFGGQSMSQGGDQGFQGGSSSSSSSSQGGSYSSHSRSPNRNGSLHNHQNGSLHNHQNGSLHNHQNGSSHNHQNGSSHNHQNGSLHNHQNGSVYPRSEAETSQMSRYASRSRSPTNR